MFPRLVALIAAATILLGLGSAVVASLDESPVPQDGASATAAIDYRVEVRGLPTLSPENASAPEGIVSHSGLDLLEVLAGADALTLQLVSARYPDALAGALESPPPAATVSSWWATVDPAQRHALIRAMPRLVGNLEGVPYSVRNTANREYLHRTIDRLEKEAESTGGRAARSAVVAQLEMLREIEESLGEPTAVPARALVAVSDEWPGRAVVALGDLDRADYVSYLVPGMFFTVQGQIVDWTEIALDVHRDKVAIGRGEFARGGSGPPNIATVAWMGYETPNLFTVGTLDQAREGSQELDATVSGLRAARGGEQPHVSLITHSYGSTAASLSLARGTLDIDAIAIAGSPGVGVQKASDLGLPEGAVFVAEAAWDPVVDTGFHGMDPGSPDFGAVIMGVAGRVDDSTGDTLAAVTGHLGYFAKHSESMRNFALIGLGLGDRVAGTSRQQLLAAG